MRECQYVLYSPVVIPYRVNERWEFKNREIKIYSPTIENGGLNGIFWVIIRELLVESYSVGAVCI